MKKFTKYLFLISILMMLASAALAQLPTPTSPYVGAPVTLLDIQGIIETIARFMIIISVLAIVILIVIGGIGIMTAGGDAAKARSGRSAVVNGIIGALVILGVGLILQTLATVVNWQIFFNV